MEASALRNAARVPVLPGLSPHLRLQSDERLVALVRRGHQGAFEALLKRYQPRLLAFCRHMLGSNEDAEDVLQEVFAAAYNALCADDRPISVRPWLYRIARNRCLNHLRRPTDAGRDSMDVFEREAGSTVADTVHRREEFRRIVADVHELPESQRTALLLREVDTLSYDQIALAMETTVPSVKSLLVRARMSLAEASEARQLTCAEVRLQLSQDAEGIAKPSAPSRRHVRSCKRCRGFKRELRKTGHALAAIAPVGPLLALKALAGGGSGTAAGKGAAGGTTAAGGAALAGGGAAGVMSALGSSVVTKAAAGVVAAAVVAMGAVEVNRGATAEQRDQSRGTEAPVEQQPRAPQAAKPHPGQRAQPRAEGTASASAPAGEQASGPAVKASGPDRNAPKPEADAAIATGGAPTLDGEGPPVVGDEPPPAHETDSTPDEEGAGGITDPADPDDGASSPTNSVDDHDDGSAPTDGSDPEASPTGGTDATPPASDGTSEVVGGSSLGG